MMRLTAALLVRVGLVMLIMASLVRFVPMPKPADVVADEFAIIVNLVLVLGSSLYLRLTRDEAEPAAKTTSKPKSVSHIRR